MTTTEMIDRREANLSTRAAHGAVSRGRAAPEPPSTLRTPYQEDVARVIQSKAFRRLKHKTQVFLSPVGDHYVTRLTHTLEVSLVSRTIARLLNLNEDLAEAISVAHDLGHGPFGHEGETALNEIYPGGFRHTDHSLRVVEVLENGGQGLNLNWEVLDGIKNHSKPRASVAASYAGVAATLEGQIVKLADSIAYLNHDIEDAFRAGVLQPDELPADTIATLGQTGRQRVDTLVLDVAIASDDRDQIGMSDRGLAAMNDLRNFMFERVYTSMTVKGEIAKCRRVIHGLYEYYIAHSDVMPAEYQVNPRDEVIERRVCDYVAGMTDRYALAQFDQLFVPRLWWV